jgi:hypothetical protein
LIFKIFLSEGAIKTLQNKLIQRLCWQDTYFLRNTKEARYQWLTPVILASWEAEIRRIMIQEKSGQIVHKTQTPK